MQRHRIALALTGLALVSAACGNSNDFNDSNDSEAADAEQADRTVNVEMVDVAFEPTVVTVAKGETVRFVFTNRGKTDHEAFLGTTAEQEEHDEEMSGGGGMGGGHGTGGMGGDDQSGVTVAPGKTGELTKQFDDPGSYEIGCHVPGHYDAGMKLAVEVS